MRRRKFLALLGLAPVVAAAAPLLAKLAFLEPKPVAIGEYVDYVNFSDMAVANELPGPWVSYRFKYAAVPSPNDADRLRFRKIDIKDSVY